jgi:hypothetical protein
MFAVANGEKRTEVVTVKMTPSDWEFLCKAEQALHSPEAPSLTRSTLVLTLAKIGAQRLLNEKSR